MSFNIAILAGGRSKRFGSNKALVNIDGKPLISRMILEIGSLEAKPGNIYVSISNEKQKNEILDVVQKYNHLMRSKGFKPGPF